MYTYTKISDPGFECLEVGESSSPPGGKFAIARGIFQEVSLSPGL